MSEADDGDIARVLHAARFACERHAGQSKNRQRRPVIDHVLEVAQLVSEAGLPGDVVVAAVLHDTIEKSETTPDELEAQFGARVRTLVDAVSDAPWEQKDAIRARLKSSVPEAQSIKCADIISNLEALARVGELTAKDLDEKAATLAVLLNAVAPLRERAAGIVERGVGG
jgi:guanosine-3',5'-bis(diphosphate) 3'-pyrophosphohydrolase